MSIFFSQVLFDERVSFSKWNGVLPVEVTIAAVNDKWRSFALKVCNDFFLHRRSRGLRGEGEAAGVSAIFEEVIGGLAAEIENRLMIPEF